MDTGDRLPRDIFWARAAVSGALTLAGLWIASSFLPALLWAIIVAIAIDPLYLRLRMWSGGILGRSALAGLTTLVIALVVVVPLAMGLTQALVELQWVLAWLADARLHGIPVPDWVQKIPFVHDDIAGWWRVHFATPGSPELQLRSLGGIDLVAHTRLIGGNVLHRAVIFAFTLLTLFFVLRDRDAIIAQVSRAGDRLLGVAGEKLATQAVRSVRGTIDGLVLVGIGEGAAMTIVYVLLGVPHPMLLGVITAIAAIFPFGAAVVFALAAALLVGQGMVGGAIALVVIGLGIVGIADHFIRPAMIGGATRLPFIWVLIGILGGVESFGLLGLFVGPATMALLILLWREFLDERRGRDDPPATPLL
jgi:predicted PurR-regulated permease PerM